MPSQPAPGNIAFYKALRKEINLHDRSNSKWLFDDFDVIQFDIKEQGDTSFRDT